MVPHALKLGFRHIDTAQIYGNEAEVGEGIASSGVARPDIFLTTKVWVDKLPHDAFVASVDESLRKLKTDHVDLLLLHWPNDAVPLPSRSAR
jgi:2,5-diketo-D-gluconate reductase B